MGSKATENTLEGESEEQSNFNGKQTAVPSCIPPVGISWGQCSVDAEQLTIHPAPSGAEPGSVPG